MGQTADFFASIPAPTGPYRVIEYAVARTILDTSARWLGFTVAAVSVVL